MNPVDELFLLRWNHIKLPSSVLQPPAEVGARDILWVMSASSYAALVTTPHCRAHQSTRPRFDSFLMSTLQRGKKKSDCENRRHDHLVSRWSQDAARIPSTTEWYERKQRSSLQPRSTFDIINYHFINFASGHRERQVVAQMMCWK